MQLFAPHAGVILLPDRAPFGTTSSVSLGDGQPVALIRWQNWSMRARFEILDATGTATVAAGGRANLWGRRYQVLDLNSRVLLELKLSVWGPAGRSTVTLPDRRQLLAKGNWTSRKFLLQDRSGETVAQLVTTSGLLSWRPDSLAFELRVPVLSIVQAVGLAQCMRAAVEAQRRSAASG